MSEIVKTAGQLQEEWERTFAPMLPVLRTSGLDERVITAIETREDAAAAVTQLALRQAIIENRKAQFAEWLKAQQADLDWRRSVYETGLRAYIAAHPDKKGGRSIKVETGASKRLTTIGLHKAKEKLTVTDKDAFFAWAEREGVWEQFVSVSESFRPNKTALNEHYKATGELPPGVDVEPEHDNLSIKEG